MPKDSSDEWWSVDLRALLAEAYPEGTIDPDEFGAVVLILDSLGASLWAIAEQMAPYMGRTSSYLYNGVCDYVGRHSRPSREAVHRVRRRFDPLGYEALAARVPEPWPVARLEPLDRDDPRVPKRLVVLWRAILDAYPCGLRTPAEYAGVICALVERGTTKEDLVALIPLLVEFSPTKVRADLESMGDARKSLGPGEYERVRAKLFG